ncbi:MAG: ribonuclease HII [Euryarchaeota archaeon]|nr:ribonuclease HII [Euryarchaeota archaeon]
MLCGIDEAGRGSVLGDLVIAGISCSEDEIERLEEIGVKDSKKLSRSERAKLYKKLVSEFEYLVVKITPPEIDKRSISLNKLEGEKFAEIINIIKPERAYVDCADVIPANFRSYIMKKLNRACELVIEHKADVAYPIVSAASIIAKVERDEGIKKLEEEYGDIGSGYPSDPKTIAFIENWYRKNHFMPSFVRKSWKTTSRVKNRRLSEF